MENEMENLLRNKLSLNEMGSDMPGDELVLAARKKVALRKAAPVKWRNILLELKNALFLQNRAYHLVLTTLIIVVCFFYFSKTDYNPVENSKRSIYTGNTKAITSSTILATINEFSVRKGSVNTSTALTSIMTFVTRN